jgi:hypothetical protein
LSTAFGRDPVRLNVGIGETVKVTGPVVVAAGLAESVAFMVRVAVPAVVGVPLIVQFEIVRPAGSVPAIRVQL